MNHDAHHEYLVVLEYQPAAPLDDVGYWMVRALQQELRAWHPAASFSRQRYALHLWVAADEPTDAAHRALVLHDRAVSTVGSPPPRLTNLEVLTEVEPESRWELPGVSAPASARYESVLTNDIYWATRALLRAETVSELTDVLVGFVVSTGGQVRHSPGVSPNQVSVEMTLDDGERLFAVSDELSVPGLIIEQSLPTLVADARTVLARLTRMTRGTRLGPGTGPHSAG